jgi:outer membrane protein
MKQIIILITCFFLISTSYAQNNIWTLEQCVKHALENNITILQAQNSLLSSEQDIVSAKGNFLPAVNSNISGGASLGNIEVFPGEFRDREFYSTSLGLGFSQSVFNGFRNINLLNQSKLSLERNQYELEKLKDDISLNVANAYLNVLFNKENLDLANSQVEFSKFQVSQVQTLVEAGSEPMSTLIETQATYSRDIQNLTIAENSHVLSLLSLSQLLQLPFEDFDIEIVQIDAPSANLMYDDVAPIINYAMENRNEIKVAERDIELSKLSTKISKSAYLPNISMLQQIFQI